MELPSTAQEYQKLRGAYKRAMLEMGETVGEPALTPLIQTLMN